MEKIKVLTVVLAMFLAIGLTATENPVKDNGKYEIKARCEIRDGGFHAKGNCKKVLEYYRQWKQLQQ